MAEQSPLECLQGNPFAQPTNLSEAIAEYREIINSVPSYIKRNLNLEAECEYSVGCLSALASIWEASKKIPNGINLLKESCIELASLIQKTFRKLAPYIKSLKGHGKLKELVDVVSADQDYDTFLPTHPQYNNGSEMSNTLLVYRNTNGSTTSVSQNNGNARNSRSVSQNDGNTNGSTTSIFQDDSWIYKWIKYGLAVLAAMAAGGFIGAAVSSCSGIGILGGIAAGAVVGGVGCVTHHCITK